MPDTAEFTNIRPVNGAAPQPLQPSPEEKKKQQTSQGQEFTNIRPIAQANGGGSAMSRFGKSFMEALPSMNPGGLDENLEALKHPINSLGKSLKEIGSGVINDQAQGTAKKRFSQPGWEN